MNENKIFNRITNSSTAEKESCGAGKLKRAIPNELSNEDAVNALYYNSKCSSCLNWLGHTCNISRVICHYEPLK